MGKEEPRQSWAAGNGWEPCGAPGPRLPPLFPVALPPPGRVGGGVGGVEGQEDRGVGTGDTAPVPGSGLGLGSG